MYQCLYPATERKGCTVLDSAAKKRAWKRKLGKATLSTTRVIALAFVGIILLGTILLMLPISSRSGVPQSFRTALFTATSATCVTGLVMGDTWSLWSGFGQVVIISLIEIGGLGFMSMASMVVFLLKKKIGLRQRLIMAQALSLNETQGVVKLQKWALCGSLLIQACGAIILFFRFLPDYGVKQAAAWGAFHAISAFCNAGFDIFGSLVPDASVAVFQNDPVVLLTLAALIIVGGLGFFVWEEVVRVRKFKNFSVYTKLVLLMTASLLALGAVLLLILEWNNPQTLGDMPAWQKVLNAFFQSASLRTAGFASIDQAGLTDGGKAISILWMLIGGSSGSTAGGVKTVTFFVLLLFVLTRIRNRNTVHVFKRTIPNEKVVDAMTIVSIVVGLAVGGAIFICATSPVNFTNALFETASALATVGLTAGTTSLLSIPAQYMIILFMYFGRVGVLTISLGFLMGDKAEDRFRYAHTNLLIG